MKLIFKNILFSVVSCSSFRAKLKPGLYTFPDASGLSEINNNTIYHQSLIHSNFVFLDSGYFVLLLRLFKGIKVNRFSGYKFITLFIDYLQNKITYKLFIVEPNIEVYNTNDTFLKNNNINISGQYIAPLYKKKFKIKDSKLLDNLNKSKPDYILINLGGGIQEILGHYLKKNLNYKPTIICTGAALSF